jgi:tRNA modification GTPase
MNLPDIKDTVVAQATPPGAGALAVIRLSGPGAFKAAASFIRKPPAARTARLLPITDGARLVDRAIVIFFPGPGSYTGEDTVEISCHGSPYVVRAILNLAVRAGARPAAPGEFTLRAFLNGKLDLAQAEAVGALVKAGSEAAHRAAITQLEGSLSARVRGIKADLVALLAELEARLDDSYEEIPALEMKGFRGRAARARAKALALAAGFEAGRGIKEGERVVIAGAPNSGKSSLLNALLGYDRAMVSRHAGTTRDTLEAELDLDGFRLIFTDTAGLNSRAATGLEREGMRRAAAALGRADTVLLVKDGSAPQSASDRRAEAETARLATGARIVRVLSKADLPARAGRAAAGRMKVSAKTGAGLPRLKALLTARARKLLRDGDQAPVTSARHFAALSAAARELGELEKVLGRTEPQAELAAEHLRGALNELSSILGETAPEEVLAGIFGSFCVGK